MDDDDVELLRRYAREGAEEAFAELVRRHLGLVYGSALRRMNGNAALAEEVAQGVFASVAHEAAALEKKVAGGVMLAGWLYIATRNAAANVLREQEAFAMSNVEMSGGAGDVPGASEAEVWAQVRPELEVVMDELGAADRDAVLLRFFEGRAFGEIGAALRVSEDAARVRVNRALEKLRGLLAKRGVRSTAAALGGLLAGNAAVATPAGMAASVTTVAVSAGSAAVVVGGAGAGLLTFMTTTKLVAGVACVMAAVSLGTAVFTQVENEKLRKDGLGSARQGGSELASRLSDAESRARESERKLEVAQKALEVALMKSKAAAAVSGANQAATTVRVADLLYADPGFQEASLKKFLTSVKLKYAPFYRKMGLSPSQIQQFEKALLTREEAQIDKNAAARSQNLSISDPNLGKIANPGLDEAYSELRRVLGDEGLKRFIDFEHVAVAQDETRPMLAASLYSEAPLTLDQADLIGEILAANRLSEKNGNVTKFTGYKWDEVATKAEAVLPKGQAEFLRQYVERVKAEQLWQDYWRTAQARRPLSEVNGTTK